MFSDRTFTIEFVRTPTSKKQCKKGGWRMFPQFRNQGDCVSFVVTGGKNPPGNLTAHHKAGRRDAHEPRAKNIGVRDHARGHNH